MEIVVIPIFYIIFYKKLKINFIFIAIFLLNLQTLISIFFAYQEYGLWAFKSATYIVDLNYIFIGNILIQDKYKRLAIPSIFWKILFIGSLYTLFIPFKSLLTKFSPTLIGFAGMPSPIFFHYTSAGIISITFFFGQNFFNYKGINSSTRLFSFISFLWS